MKKTYKECLAILEDYLEDYYPEINLNFVYSEKWKGE